MSQWICLLRAGLFCECSCCEIGYGVICKPAGRTRRKQARIVHGVCSCSPQSMPSSEEGESGRSPSDRHPLHACRRSLPRVGLVGPLTAALGDLRKLVTLDLSFNQLTGSLPPAWGAAAAGALRTLLLTSNQLSGSLPPSWAAAGRFPHLISMQLGTNKISGGLPATWAAGGAASSAPAGACSCERGRLLRPGDPAVLGLHLKGSGVAP